MCTVQVEGKGKGFGSRQLIAKTACNTTPSPGPAYSSRDHDATVHGPRQWRLGGADNTTPACGDLGWGVSPKVGI